MPCFVEGGKAAGQPGLKLVALLVVGMRDGSAQPLVELADVEDDLLVVHGGHEPARNHEVTSPLDVDDELLAAHVSNGPDGIDAFARIHLKSGPDGLAHGGGRIRSVKTGMPGKPPRLATKRVDRVSFGT